MHLVLHPLPRKSQGHTRALGRRFVVAVLPRPQLCAPQNGSRKSVLHTVPVRWHPLLRKPVILCRGGRAGRETLLAEVWSAAASTSAQAQGCHRVRASRRHCRRTKCLCQNGARAVAHASVQGCHTTVSAQKRFDSIHQCSGIRFGPYRRARARRTTTARSLWRC